MARRFYWSRQHVRAAAAALRERTFDLFVANDLDALPVALELARGAPVLFDAHEYAPLEFEDRWFWRFFFAGYRHDLCRRYLRAAGAMTTVCQGIAERYATEYGIRVEVITNAAPLHDLPLRRTDAARIRMIHHGLAIPSRRTEAMIDLMDHVDERYTLDLVLLPGIASYIEDLRRRAAGNPRIRFLPPVAMPDLVAFSSAYDIGLFLLPPTNFNYRMALPNKFFEFLQARLALAIGPSPEMASLVSRFRCGVVAPDFKPRSLAEALIRLDAAEIDRMKEGADRAARTMNAEANAARLLQLVAGLLAQTPLHPVLALAGSR
jgi:glycosyltransferase involved in cell wall biosynthesis